ncbi:MAG: class I fructose-bisphosphate aldolase [Armatimonadota bacterium]
MPGHWIRLNRLFSDGRRAVVVAADHGMFIGPQPGSTDLPGAIEAWRDADGILLSPGMLQACGHVFSYRGAPSAVVRLDWSTVFGTRWGFTGAHPTGVLAPADALAMGADLGIATFTFTMAQEQVDRDNIAHFARLAEAKRACGLPLIGELFPVAPDDLTADELFRQVHIGCRVLAELGADVIKTFFTGPRFAETVEATPVPILVLGAEKLPNEIDALELAQRAIRAGARGVVFGRNVTQAQHPSAMIRALHAVVKDEADPAEAAREAGLL